MLNSICMTSLCATYSDIHLLCLNYNLSVLTVFLMWDPLHKAPPSQSVLMFIDMQHRD